MISFIAGFVFCVVIAYAAKALISIGFKEKVKKNGILVAVYKDKSDTWEITKSYDKVVKEIEYRRKFEKPGSVKYVD